MLYELLRLLLIRCDHSCVSASRLISNFIPVSKVPTGISIINAFTHTVLGPVSFGIWLPVKLRMRRSVKAISASIIRTKYQDVVVSVIKTNCIGV